MYLWCTRPKVIITRPQKIKRLSLKDPTGKSSSPKQTERTFFTQCEMSMYIKIQKFSCNYLNVGNVCIERSVLFVCVCVKIKRKTSYCAVYSMHRDPKLVSCRYGVLTDTEIFPSTSSGIGP